jgi:hypothetical protein
MLTDSRLPNGGLGELARLLGDALPEPEAVRSCATRLDIRTSGLRAGTVDDQWQSLVELADDNQAVTVTALLTDVLAMLPEGKKAASLRAWAARGAHSASLAQNMSECSRLLREVTSFADPCEASAQVFALSGVLRELVEALQQPTTGLGAAATQGDGTTKALTSAAQQAAGAVRRLQVGIALAPEALSRVGVSASAAAAFEAHFAVVGLLVDAVTATEREVSRLLGLMREAWPG